MSDDTETGTTGSDILIGGDGNSTLDGKAGADTMYGNLGDDTYYVDNINDVVIEDYNEGIDTVRATVAYTLSDNVENLIIVSGAVAGTGNALDNYLTGSASANVLYGLGGNDTLDGAGGTDTLIGGLGDDTYIMATTGDVITENAGEGNDTILAGLTFSLANYANVENLTLTGIGNFNATGNALDNILTGNGGNNTLNGGLGADALSGGMGNDTYIFDNAGDTAFENAGGGTDTLQSSISVSLVPANIEIVTLTGSAAIDATGNAGVNTITGNSGVNILHGGDGDDTLDGGAGGNDTLYGEGGNDVLYSSAAGATMFGGDGNDIMSGGYGTEIMYGGAGNDTFAVYNATDTIVENQGEGIDTVISIISYTLTDNIENLTLNVYGGGAVNGTGNDLDNLFYGSTGKNILTGLDGNDTFYGLGGNDTFIGGNGNDTYYVDTVAVATIENAGEGTDTIYSSVTLSLALRDNVENLTLLGTGALKATGNALDNVLIGNSGNNTLDGGAGADTLYGDAGNDRLIGGADNDTFLFKAATAFSGTHTVSDFNVAEHDVIDIHDILSGYHEGIDNLGDFVKIENSGLNSILSVDIDGAGTAYGWQQVATLTGVTGLTDEDALVASHNLIVSG